MNFNQRCYEELVKVPKGKVITYASLAKAVGVPRGARAVGNAMKNNPYAPKVPCHRVVKSNGEIGEYAFDKKKKIEILKLEGVEIINGKIDLHHFGFYIKDLRK